MTERVLRRLRLGALGAMLAVSIACAGDLPAAAQTAWRTFRDGVANKDVEKVASVSRFPIISNDLGGGNIATREALGRKFDAIFGEPFRECLTTKQPQPSVTKGDYVINCDGVLFGFRLKGGEYRFAYIENVNE